ncbi:MAG: DUF3021 domain-containing protein [Clostridia bacterium]|nr:DUF3021 domain-containing protein [Clostridia bacterium]
MWQYIKYTLFGIAWGCTWLVAMGVVLSAADPASFAGMMRNYPQQALGAALVGVASTLPARVYFCRRLPYIWRFAVHMVITLSVYFPVSFSLGWIPYRPQAVGMTVLEILIGVAIFLGIWTIFFLCNRKEARRINARVREMMRRDGEP